MIPFFARRPIVAHALFATLLLGGFFSLTVMPVESFPSMSYGMVVIPTYWPGASPEDVEQFITNKLEKQLQNLDHLLWIRSFSSFGLSTIMVKFEEELDEDDYQQLYLDAQSEVRKVDDLPEDAHAPNTIKIKTDRFRPAVIIAVTGDIPEIARIKIADALRSRLQRMPGVAQITLDGKREREIKIHIHRDQALRHHLTLLEIAQIIQKENPSLPSGSIKEHGTEILVRAEANLHTIAQIEDIIIQSDIKGNELRLKDLADIEWGYEKWTTMNRAFGKPAIFLTCTKQEQANAIELIPRIREEVRQFHKGLPHGVEFAFYKDNVVYINKVLQVLKSNLSLGLLLVLIILWVCVGFSNAFLAAMGIPFAFLCSLIFLNWLGSSVNEVMLVSLVLVSGMVVDDAIIILENMHRHYQEGKSLVEAAVDGAEEVFWPVLSATATTVVSFLPMLIMVGVTGKIMSIIPKTIAVTLLASLVEAFCILPCHYVELRIFSAKLFFWKKKKYVQSKVNLGIIGKAYSFSVQTFIRHRYFTVPGLLCAMVAGLFSLYAIRPIPVVLFPSDYHDFWVNIKVPVGKSLEYTAEKTKEVEAIVAQLPKGEMLNQTAWIGRFMDENYRVSRFSHLAQITVTLDPKRKSARIASDIMSDLRRRIAEADLQGFTSIEVAGMPSGPPTGKPVAVSIRGNDIEILRKLAAKVKFRLEKMAGVSEVTDDIYFGGLEITVKIREEQAARYNLSRHDVLTATSAAIEGLEATEIHDIDQQYKVRIRYRPEDIAKIELLKKIHVKTGSGAIVRLEDVAVFERDTGYSSFQHYNSLRSITVTANVDNETMTSSKANLILQDYMKPYLQQYPDYIIEYGGEFEETSRSFSSLRYAFIIAMVLIYMILGTQFNSAIQPFIVMSVIPFSMLGVAFGLWVFHLPFTMLIFITMVGLAGVVVNDSLVLIDFINREKQQFELKQALLNACVKRLRPILLTTATTVLGLLPLSLGLTGKSITWGPMATGFSWGLTFSTILTLYVVPSCYHIIYDIQNVLGKNNATLRENHS